MAELIVALDLPTSGAALGLVDELADAVGFYKVGSPLFTRGGPDIIRALRSRGKRVFLDLKYHDIPNTVAHAVESATTLDVSMLTIHASGGTQMLRAARKAVGHEGPKLLGVTILTSFAPTDVEEVWNKEVLSVRDEVVRLAALAADAGLDGVVTSPLEVEPMKRRHGGDFLVITPGIRPPGVSPTDQARTSTPANAVRAGADFLVVGRPVFEAPDPVAAVEQILSDMHGAAQVVE